MLGSLILQHPFYTLLSIPCLFLLAHILPWLYDSHGIRDVPGPFLAKFSDFWLGYWAALGKRSEHVHKLHRKYGATVRIAPNHVSIADSDALQAVYGHGTGTQKSDFYDAFVSLQRGLFNTRSRPEHTRKRKIVSHIFSQKNVLEFEPNIRVALLELTQQWDMLCSGGLKGARGSEGEGGWIGRDGLVWYDCLPWYNYLAFDIIGDLAFGEPFGMLRAAADIAPVAVDNKKAMASYEASGPEAQKMQVKHVPAVAILNARGDFSASMGVLPPWIRPWIKTIPWYARGSVAVKNLAGIAVAAVGKRLATDATKGLEGVERVDLLRRLQEARDENGRAMGKEELTAEALTQLIAGSDTTSNSSCAITYYLAMNPVAQAALQKELDDAVGPPSLADDPILHYEQVKNLHYLEAAINEGLRLHSTSSIGLPRLVPLGGLEVLGRMYKEGTVLSVPSFSIHREKRTWGNDVEAYRPERWFEEDRTEAINKCFNPFSFGPRACVGKNLATMELLMIIGSLTWRYEFVPSGEHCLGRILAKTLEMLGGDEEKRRFISVLHSCKLDEQMKRPAQITMSRYEGDENNVTSYSLRG